MFIGTLNRCVSVIKLGPKKGFTIEIPNESVRLVLTFQLTETVLGKLNTCCIGWKLKIFALKLRWPQNSVMPRKVVLLYWKTKYPHMYLLCISSVLGG